MLNHRWWCISKSQPMSSLKHIMKTSEKLNEIILPIYLLPSSQSIQSASLSLSNSVSQWKWHTSAKKVHLFLFDYKFHLSYCTANGFSTDLEEHRICWQELKISRSRRHSCIFLSNCSSQKFHLLRCNPIFIRTLQFVLQQFLSNHLLEEALVHTEAHQISMWIHVNSVAMHISIWF